MEAIKGDVEGRLELGSGCQNPQNVGRCINPNKCITYPYLLNSKILT